MSLCKKALIALSGVGLIVAASVAAVRLQEGSRTREAPLTADEFGRFNVAVYVNGEGPFLFLVDTGAATSCVSPALAGRLKLARVPGVKLNVQGTSGTQAGAMYLATSYKSDVFDRMLEPLVGLINAAAVNDGVVGMNAFTSRRIEFDFLDHRLVSGPSGIMPATFRAVPAQLKGTDVLVDVEIDGIAAKAIVDTGARRTIANAALRDRLGLQARDPRLTEAEPSQGATTQHLPASAASFRVLRLGPAQFNSPQIIFSELDLFTRRGLHDTPAMLLGMDMLGRLQALAVDYPRSEVQVRPRSK